MKAEAALASLTAAFGAVAAEIAARLSGLAPPDAQGLTFFSFLVWVLGCVLGLGLFFLRDDKKYNRKIVLAIAALFFCAGAISAFIYYGQYRERVSPRGFVVAQLVVPGVIEEIRRNPNIRQCPEIAINEETQTVTFACARDAADRWGYTEFVDADALKRSKEALLYWYMAAAFAFILAIFLPLDEYLQIVAKRFARQRAAKRKARPADT